MAKIHLVLRNSWASGDRHAYHNHGSGRGTPLFAYRDRDQADERRAELEYHARIRVNPYSHPSSIDYFPELDDHGIARALYDRGIRQPAVGLPVDGDWATWWADCASELSPRDAMAVWDILGGGEFYEVVSVDLEDRA
ncbi:MAG: hypothetical protein U0746_22245 [Gemmataceae bacterium]